MIGANVTFTESTYNEETKKREGENGSYNKKTNTITIDVYAGIKGFNVATSNADSIISSQTCLYALQQQFINYRLKNIYGHPLDFLAQNSYYLIRGQILFTDCPLYLRNERGVILYSFSNFETIQDRNDPGTIPSNWFVACTHIPIAGRVKDSLYKDPKKDHYIQRAFVGRVVPTVALHRCIQT